MLYFHTLPNYLIISIIPKDRKNVPSILVISVYDTSKIFINRNR